MSAGIDKLSEDALDEIVQIALAAASSAAANAGTNRIIFNAIEHRSLTDGIWEVMLISAPIGGAIKLANIHRDQLRYKEYLEKKGALEAKLKEREIALGNGNNDLTNLDNEIANLQAEFDRLAAEVLPLKENWNLAKEEINKIINNLKGRGYLEDNRAALDTRSTIERVIGK